MSKSKVKSKSSDKMKPLSMRYSLNNAIINYFLIVMFVVFPLFINFTFDGSFPFVHFERGYYGIRHQKYYLFLTMAAITAIAEILLLITEGFSTLKKNHDLTPKGLVSKLSFTDWSVLSLVLVCAISTIFSSYKEIAFFGEVTIGKNDHGRNNGLLLILIYVLVYFLITRGFRYKEHVFTALAVTAAAVYLLAVLNCFNIDPLNMFVLFKNDKLVSRDFLTTIGNKNMFSTYICVTLPVAVTMSVHTKKFVNQIIFLCAAGLGAMAMIVCDSDSAVLGIGAFIAIFLAVYARNIARLKKFFLALTVMLFSAKLLGIFSALSNESHKTLEAFPSTLMRSNTVYIILIAFAAITALLYFLDKNKPDLSVPKAVPIVILSAFGAGVVGIIAAMVYFSNFDSTTNLGSFERLLRFNDAWGTHRGVMWIRSFWIFRDASFFHKLFGTGPETYYYAFSPYFKDLYKFGDGSTDAAHNEYLQYLITIGIAGLGAYFAFVGGALKSAFKTAKQNPIALVFASAVVAYLAQAVVNIALPIGTPLFIIFVSLCEAISKQPKTN